MIVAEHPSPTDRETREQAMSSIDRRAEARWPRLDRAALRRCHHDPRRIAALVARRTNMAPEAILRILLMPTLSDEELATWFG